MQSAADGPQNSSRSYHCRSSSCPLLLCVLVLAHDVCGAKHQLSHPSTHHHQMLRFILLLGLAVLPQTQAFARTEVSVDDCGGCTCQVIGFDGRPANKKCNDPNHVHSAGHNTHSATDNSLDVPLHFHGRIVNGNLADSDQWSYPSSCAVLYFFLLRCLFQALVCEHSNSDRISFLWGQPGAARHRGDCRPLPRRRLGRSKHDSCAFPHCGQSHNATGY